VRAKKEIDGLRQPSIGLNRNRTEAAGGLASSGLPLHRLKSPQPQGGGAGLRRTIVHSIQTAACRRAGAALVRYFGEWLAQITVDIGGDHMTEEPENIVLQHLIAIRTRLDAIDARLVDIADDQTVLAQIVLRIERDMVQVKPLLGQMGTRIALLIREGIPVKPRHT
jgi:hypothetical protein